MANNIDGEWLIPFKGRNPSGAIHQNFLWKQGSVYVMDNHRAAAWCWLQHIDPSKSHSLLHIDRHYDCLQSQLQTWLAHIPPPFSKISLATYLALSYDLGGGTGRYPVICWGNYLSIYLEMYGSAISSCRFATHDDGDKPNHKSVLHSPLWEIPTELDGWLSAQSKPWIVNIDLDYFFWHEHDEDKDPDVMVSDDYLKTVFGKLREKIEDGVVAVTTIALTPDSGFTGPWEQSEQLAERVLQYLGIDFKLP